MNRLAIPFALVLLACASSGSLLASPDLVTGCTPAGPGRRQQLFHGEVCAGERFSQKFAPDLVFALEPIATGWQIAVYRGAEKEDLSRLTPPWHFVPNPRMVEGWHFRNESNTGPNDGTVNAPGERRDFIFSPEVGKTIDGPESKATPTDEEMRRVADFGQGTLKILDYGLADLAENQKARMVWLKFEGCVSWPADYEKPGK